MFLTRGWGPTQNNGGAIFGFFSAPHSAGEYSYEHLWQSRSKPHFIKASANRLKTSCLADLSARYATIISHIDTPYTPPYLSHLSFSSFCRPSTFLGLFSKTRIKMLSSHHSWTKPLIKLLKALKLMPA